VAFFEEIAPEEQRIWPERDSLNIVKGFIGSYANAILSVQKSRLQEFSNDILNLKDNQKSLTSFYKKYLVSRHNPFFWDYYDNMMAHAVVKDATKQSDRFEGSVIDLNRYINN
jgi:hypothetical protein